MKRVVIRLFFCIMIIALMVFFVSCSINNEDKAQYENDIEYNDSANETVSLTDIEIAGQYILNLHTLSYTL